MNINEIIALILQAVLVPLLIYAANLARNYLMAQTKSLQVQRALDQATDAVIKAVDMTSQTFVDEIKGTTEWSKEAMKQAFDLSFATAVSILGKEGTELLELVTGDAKSYIEAAIESAVAEGKKYKIEP